MPRATAPTLHRQTAAVVVTKGNRASIGHVIGLGEALQMQFALNGQLDLFLAGAAAAGQ